MVRRFILGFAFVAFVFSPVADAQNPRWPPPAGTTPADLMNPALWPDDHGWGYDIEGDGMSCIDDSGGRCWSGDEGNWNYYSWIPPQAVEFVDPVTGGAECTTDGDCPTGLACAPVEGRCGIGFREEELELGAGTWSDMAWQHTIGDKSVVIAVLDSGIQWRERELVNQHYINQAELEAPGLHVRCLPEPPAGHMGDPIDLDGDGYLSMRDWFVGRDSDERATISGEIDSMGNGNGHADPGDLITFCSDGMDDDTNGYTDDISGWDFHFNDNDPASNDHAFQGGHGTGEARWAAAEGNNGAGDIGQCPGCRVLMVRVGTSFVADAQDYAQGVIFSVDSGARIVQEALGTVNNTSFMRRAHKYAYDNDVLVVASAADEDSFHHNFPATSNHTLYVHAIQWGGTSSAAAFTYLAYNNCSNYGPQLVLSAPGTSCSSEATGVTAGVAGLVYSAALDDDFPGGPLDPPLSAEELRQLILTGAQDIDVPESQPSHPNHDRRLYPSLPGWDERFGYGRINSWNSVMAIREGRIPPEVDIVTPDWFRVLYPEQTPNVTITGRIAARRAPAFDWVIEWAPAEEPADDEFTTIAEGSDATAPIEGELATWDISSLTIDNVGVPHNRFLVTVRVRVTAKYGGAIGDVRGEQRRAFHIVRDDSLLPGFPITLGVRNDVDEYPAASGEGSPKLADIDGDDVLEIVYADTDGLLHVYNHDTTEVAGFPVQLGNLRGFDAADPNNILGSAAYASGAVPTEDVASSVITGVPAIGDLDGDGTTEIVVATLDGDVFGFHADATPIDGFPIALPELGLAPGVNPESDIERSVIPPPTLADLDTDGNLEIVIVASDGNLYVYRHDGTMQPGFPVPILAPQLWAEPADARPGRMVAAAAVGDVDGDGIPDIAVGSNETGFEAGSGAAHLIHGDGMLHPGGPSHANWPVTVDSFRTFPFVGEGTTSPPAMADVNGDGITDLALAGTAFSPNMLEGVQPPRMPGDPVETIVILAANQRGPLSNITDPNDRPFFNIFAAGSFGDLDQDGVPDFVTGGAGLKLVSALGGGWENVPFAHQIGVWNALSGEMFPGFPQRIEDYLFFVNPTMGDVDADEYPELVVGSAGYLVHAWDACGEESAGWPKMTGGWITSGAAIGDIDGDDLNEVVVTTRSGYMFAWNTEGDPNGAMPWPEYRHDNHNTGNYDAPLSNGGSRTVASAPIECDIPLPDGGVGDGGLGSDPGGGGCDCRAAPGRDGGGLAALVVLALAVARRRRRRI